MTLVQIFWTFKETVVCPRFIHKRFKGYKKCPIEIRFVGLFDTVDQTAFTELNLTIPKRVKFVAHAISHDKRYDFPLTRLNNRANERIFPGDHSDIGRGHGSDTNELSITPLEYIYNSAVKAGVKFRKEPDIGTHWNVQKPHDLTTILPWALRENTGRTNLD